MVSNLLNLFANSSLVPTPSVLATSREFLSLYLPGSKTEANFPMLFLLNLFNFFLKTCCEYFPIYFVNLSADSIFTPLFL